MSGETEKNISAWTNDTVLLHLSKLIDANDLRYEQRYVAQQTALRDALAAQEKAVAAALEAAQRAVEKAEVASEKRLDSVNEFRAQLSDQATTFLPRGEYAVTQDALMECLAKVEAYMLSTGGSAKGRSDLVAFTISGGAAIAAVVAVILALTGN